MSGPVPADTIRPAEAYLSERELAERFNIPARTAQRYRLTGGGPPFIRVGKRRILYREADVSAWLAQRTFASRAAEMAVQSCK